MDLQSSTQYEMNLAKWVLQFPSTPLSAPCWSKLLKMLQGVPKMFQSSTKNSKHLQNASAQDPTLSKLFLSRFHISKAIWTHKLLENERNKETMVANKYSTYVVAKKHSTYTIRNPCFLLRPLSCPGRHCDIRIYIPRTY